MTANQINYSKYLEEARANQAKEQLTREANYENARHNQQMEFITQTGNELNYNASIYHANVSKYSAELNYSAAKYASDLNYEINQRKNAIAWMEYQEQAHHNIVMENVAKREAEIKQSDTSRKWFETGAQGVLNALNTVKSLLPILA